MVTIDYDIVSHEHENTCIVLDGSPTEDVFVATRKGIPVETRLLAYEHATTVKEIALWANDLIGKEVPGDPGYTVVRVVQFQVINGQSSYDTMILVEVTERQFETQVALREADIEVIQELTSSIDEPA